jgi:hypothetical protein
MTVLARQAVTRALAIRSQPAGGALDPRGHRAEPRLRGPRARLPGGPGGRSQQRKLVGLESVGERAVLGSRGRNPAGPIARSAFTAYRGQHRRGVLLPPPLPGHRRPGTQDSRSGSAPLQPCFYWPADTKDSVVIRGPKPSSKTSSRPATTPACWPT